MPSSVYLRAVTRVDPDLMVEQLSQALGHCTFDPQRSYADQVHEVLSDAIIRGRLLPGMALSEAAIAAVVGVSRTPVREALRQLERESLVDVYPQAGTKVAPVRLKLLHEGRFIRRALECENLRELVKTITPAQIAELDTLLARQRAAIDADCAEEFFVWDEALHRCLMAFTGRERLWDWLQSFKQHHDRIRFLFLAEEAEERYREHCTIVAHLAAHDIDQLMCAMQAHINAVEGHIEALRVSAPDGYLID